jgi:hypothetical protein
MAVFLNNFQSAPNEGHSNLLIPIAFCNFHGEKEKTVKTMVHRDTFAQNDYTKLRINVNKAKRRRIGEEGLPSLVRKRCY